MSINIFKNDDVKSNVMTPSEIRQKLFEKWVRIYLYKQNHKKDLLPIYFFLICRFFISGLGPFEYGSFFYYLAGSFHNFISYMLHMYILFAWWVFYAGFRTYKEWKIAKAWMYLELMYSEVYYTEGVDEELAKKLFLIKEGRVKTW